MDKGSQNGTITLTEMDDVETYINEQSQLTTKLFSASTETLRECINTQLSHISMFICMSLNIDRHCIRYSRDHIYTIYGDTHLNMNQSTMMHKK